MIVAFRLMGIVLCMCMPLSGCYLPRPGQDTAVSVYQRAAPSLVEVVCFLRQGVSIDRFVRQEVIGSGSIIDDRGHILTNCHVLRALREAQSIEAVLFDGSRWPASVEEAIR